MKKGKISYNLRRKISKYTFVTIRSDAFGNFKCTKPCKECFETMKNYGLKKIVYIDEDGNFIEQNLNQMNIEECYQTPSQKIKGIRKKINRN